jgi:hypothetical protein
MDDERVRIQDQGAIKDWEAEAQLHVAQGPMRSFGELHFPVSRHPPVPQNASGQLQDLMESSGTSGMISCKLADRIIPLQSYPADTSVKRVKMQTLGNLMGMSKSFCPISILTTSRVWAKA